MTIEEIQQTLQTVASNQAQTSADIDKRVEMTKSTKQDLFYTPNRTPKVVSDSPKGGESL